jgi:hypothetical protein
MSAAGAYRISTAHFEHRLAPVIVDADRSALRRCAATSPIDVLTLKVNGLINQPPSHG